MTLVTDDDARRLPLLPPDCELRRSKNGHVAMAATTAATTGQCCAIDFVAADDDEEAAWPPFSSGMAVDMLLSRSI